MIILMQDLFSGSRVNNLKIVIAGGNTNGSSITNCKTLF